MTSVGRVRVPKNTSNEKAQKMSKICADLVNWFQENKIDVFNPDPVIHQFGGQQCNRDR